jgi:hypothetical protein
VSVVHEIKPIDFPRRVDYCQWFLNHLNNNDIPNKTFFSDESWFHFSGYVNSQNMRSWHAENPHEFIETSLHPQKIVICNNKCRTVDKQFITPFH